MENKVNIPKMKPLSKEDLEKVNGGNGNVTSWVGLCDNGREHTWEWDSKGNFTQCVMCSKIL